MTDLNAIEWRSEHGKEVSSVWTPHGLVRASDQGLIVALLREALEQWKR